jgi:hypothetical protein
MFVLATSEKQTTSWQNCLDNVRIERKMELQLMEICRTLREKKGWETKLALILNPLT